MMTFWNQKLAAKVYPPARFVNCHFVYAAILEPILASYVVKLLRKLLVNICAISLRHLQIPAALTLSATRYRVDF